MMGVTTPLTAARPSSKPAYPFETTNQFTPLSSTNNNSTDDGSGQSGDILLTPADGDVVVQLDGARKIAAVATIAARTDDTAPFSTAATNDTDPINTAATSASAGDIAVAPIDAAAPHRTFTLEDMAAMIVANTVGITSLRELMKENVDTVKQLTQTMTNTSTQVDRLSTAVTEVQETAERSYCLASNASLSFASHEAKLLRLANDVSRLTSDIDGLHDSTKNTPDITTHRGVRN